MPAIPMPRLSDSMEEGTLLSWLVEDGQHVGEGDELVEIETDKAAMTYSAEFSGVLSIVVPEGETVPVGKPIARIEDETGGSPVASTTEENPEPDSAPAVEDTASTPDPAPAEIASAMAEAELEKSATAPSRGLRATPLARRIANAHNVALPSVPGTGPMGRITKSDVLAAAGIAERPTDPMSSLDGTSHDVRSQRTPIPTGDSDGRVERLSSAQRVVARRMAEAKATVPHFQVQAEAVMDEAIALRAGLKDAGASVVPSYNDMFVKAAATALREHPRANGTFRDDAFVLRERIDVGIAVAADNELLVPTIANADSKTLSGIASESREVAERVRSGRITPPELSGATFTVSNLGMYGMTAIFPVINPPQAAILGVAALRPVVQRGADGELVDRSLLTLTLSCDHRILYGADAAQFLSALRDLIEAPLALLR